MIASATGPRGRVEPTTTSSTWRSVRFGDGKRSLTDFDLLARAPCTLVASMRAGSGSDKSRARTAATAWTAADPTTAPSYSRPHVQLALTDDREFGGHASGHLPAGGPSWPRLRASRRSRPLQPSLVSPTALSTRTRWLRRKIMNPGAVRTGGEHIEYAGASRQQAQSDDPCGRLAGLPGRLAGLPGRLACRLAGLSGGRAHAQPPRRYRRRQRSGPPVWARARRDPYVL